MLPISPSLRAKLDARATTFCHCWRLARRDGAVMGFTDHDRDLVFNGVTFRANTGLTASEVESVLGLGATSAEASGALSDESLREGDLLNGLYDGASVESWLVDWRDVTDRVLLDVTTIGDVRRSENAFAAELRSSAHLFDQQQGRAYQKGCSAELGDARCGVNLASATFSTTGVVVNVSGGALVLDLAASFDANFFSSGRLTFTSGANQGASFAVKSHRQEALRAILELWTTPGATIAAGDAASLIAGCDKTAATCRDKFANIVRFRGFPHMPGNDRVVSYANSLSRAMDGGSFFR